MTSLKLLAFSIIVLLSTQHSALAWDNPTYQNGILTIPSVDTLEQVGQYRGIIMIPKNDDTWTLRYYDRTYGMECILTKWR